ncbi:hypothetical protein V6R21_13890 [Limibacter armeniacum]|uniref:hypothetical protein n=1 Tax=Limibacter armeniacum TaxID=466084 RepID=UPI002FE60F94
MEKLSAYIRLGLLLGSLVLMTLTVSAQQSVLVTDHQMRPLEGAGVSVNDSDFQLTNVDGKATLEVKGRPKKVKAIKDGMAMVSWAKRGDLLHILMKEVDFLRIDGQVADANGKPLGGVIIGVTKGDFTDEARTDNEGRFVLRYPLKEEKLTQQDFELVGYQITDAEFRHGSLNVVVRLWVGELANYEVTGQPFTVKLLDKRRNPMKTTAFQLGDARFVTDEEGKAKVMKRNLSDKVMVAGLKLNSQKGDPKKNLLVLQFGEPEADPVVFSNSSIKEAVVQASLEQDSLIDLSDLPVDDHFDELATRIRLQNQQLALESEKIRREISEVVSKLKDDSSLTDEQRENYRNRLAALEGLLNTIKENFLTKNKEASSMLENLQLDFMNAEDRMRLLEEQQKAEKAAFQKKVMIAIGIVVILLCLVVLFMFLTNRYRNEKRRVEVLKSDLEVTLESVEKKNHTITQSIRYAETIQQAILPSERMLKDFFDDVFVYFKPKDIVSGDFYWANKVGEDVMYVAVVDCTGHGVPGRLCP